MASSASIAASTEHLPQEPNRGPARSQSEPDFHRNAKQAIPRLRFKIEGSAVAVAASDNGIKSFINTSPQSCFISISIKCCAQALEVASWQRNERNPTGNV